MRSFRWQMHVPIPANGKRPWPCFLAMNLSNGFQIPAHPGVKLECGKLWVALVMLIRGKIPAVFEAFHGWRPARGTGECGDDQRCCHMTLVLFNSGGFRSSKLCTLRCFSVVNVILYTRLYIYIYRYSIYMCTCSREAYRSIWYIHW